MEMNVLGNKLEICGCEPMTGWHRDGYYNTDHTDHSIHTFCAIVTEEILIFSKKKGK